MSYWYDWFSWWWARCCSKHVGNWNKRIEKRIVLQVVCLRELYQDARSTKHKTLLIRYKVWLLFPFRVRIALNFCKFIHIINKFSPPNHFRHYLREVNPAIPKTEAVRPSEISELTCENIRRSTTKKKYGLFKGQISSHLVSYTKSLTHFLFPLYVQTLTIFTCKQRSCV